MITAPAAIGSRRSVVGATAAAAAACLVVGMVDPVKTPLAPPCPFRAVTGLQCPFCGATRATHQLLHGHLAAAFRLNALYLVALPLAAWAWLAWGVAAFGGPKLPTIRPSARLNWALGAVLVAFTVIRNVS